MSIRRLRLPAALLLTLLGACVCAGCQDQLFPVNEPRSQFDRFDAIRDKRPEASVEDEFGAKHPNLRGRLLTSE